MWMDVVMLVVVGSGGGGGGDAGSGGWLVRGQHTSLNQAAVTEGDSLATLSSCPQTLLLSTLPPTHSRHTLQPLHLPTHSTTSPPPHILHDLQPAPYTFQTLCIPTHFTVSNTPPLSPHTPDSVPPYTLQSLLSLTVGFVKTYSLSCTLKAFMCCVDKLILMKKNVCL